MFATGPLAGTDHTTPKSNHSAITKRISDGKRSELTGKSFLRPIYTVRLCRMQQAYDRPTTRIVSCKSNLPLAYDCRARHEKCRRILKHVLKRCDNRSRN